MADHSCVVREAYDERRARGLSAQVGKADRITGHVLAACGGCGLVLAEL